MAVGAHGQTGVPAVWYGPVVGDSREGPGSVMILHHLEEGLSVQALMRKSLQAVIQRTAFWCLLVEMATVLVMYLLIIVMDTLDLFVMMVGPTPRQL